MSTDPQSLARDLREQKAQLVAYLLSKTKTGDWHGVADAAMDIREVDAQLDLLSKLESRPV